MLNIESDRIIGEHRLYKADIWSAETDEHAFTVYIFAPFLCCAIKESFKHYNLKKNGLYLRVAGECSREEAVRVIEEEPERIMFYHPGTDDDYFPDCLSDEEPAPEHRKRKRRLRIVTEIEVV